MSRQPYLISFLAHATILVLLIIIFAPKPVIHTPPKSVHIELVKAPTPAAPIVQQPPKETPIEPPKMAVPRIQPRLSVPSPVAIAAEPLPIPAQPVRIEGAPTVTVKHDTIIDPGKPLSRTAPIYPEAAERHGIEGIVELHFTIKADGTTDDIQVYKSDPPDVFDEAAIRSQKTARYAPATRDGTPVDQPNCLVVFHFKQPK